MRNISVVVSVVLMVLVLKLCKVSYSMVIRLLVVYRLCSVVLLSRC